MIVRHARAVTAIVAHAAYLYEHAGEGVFDHFLARVEATLERLERSPRIGRIWQDPHIGDVRVWRVKGFPSHLLFYRPVAGGIELLHLFHASQDIASILAEGGWF